MEWRDPTGRLWFLWGPAILLMLTGLLTAAPQAERRVAVLIPGDVEYFRIQHEAMRAEAERCGLELVVFNARWDARRQIQQLERVSGAGFAVIALCSVDGRALDVAPDVLAGSGAPLITFTNALGRHPTGRHEGVRAHIGRNEYEGGVMLGHAALGAAPSGDHSVGLIEGGCGTTPAVLRAEGTRAALDSDPRAHIAWQHCTTAWSTEGVLEFIDSAPRVDVIATQWAEAAVVIARHVERLDWRPAIVTLESNQDAMELLASGQIDAVTELSIADEGRATVAAADAIAAERPVPAFVRTHERLVVAR